MLNFPVLMNLEEVLPEKFLKLKAKISPFVPYDLQALISQPDGKY
jgi:hypothetical protein